MATVEALYDTARHGSDLRVLDEAIELATSVERSLSADDVGRAGVEAELGRCLRLKYELTGERTFLHAAVMLLRAAAARAEAHGDPLAPVCWHNLGNALADWYELTRELDAVIEAERAFRRALKLLPDLDFRRCHVDSALADILHARYRHEPASDVLVEATRAARRAMQSMAPESAGYAVTVKTLALLLNENHRVTGRLDALEESRSILIDVLARHTYGASDRVALLVTLAKTLMFVHSAGGEDIRLPLRTVENDLRAVIDATGAGPRRAGYLNSLGNLLVSRYQETGDSAALDRSVKAHREAAASTGEGHETYPEFTANLANGLTAQYDRLGDMRALTEALGLLRAAAGLAPHIGIIRNSLAGVLLRCYRRDRNLALWTESAREFDAALARVLPGHEDRSTILTNLGNAYHERWRDTGSPGDAANANSRYREVLSPGLCDSASLMALSNLGGMLFDKYTLLGNPSDIEESVELLRRAKVLAGRAHIMRGTILRNLGASLRALHDRTPLPALSVEATATLREAALLRASAPRDRVTAARSWGQVAAQAGNKAEALSAYRTAVNLLPAAASPLLDRADQETQIGAFVGLASEAAAAAIEVGDEGEALRLVEAARGVLVGRTLQLRAEVAALRHVDPVLAERFLRHSRELRSFTTYQTTSPLGTGGVGGNAIYAGATVGREHAYDRWIQTLAEIRTVPRFAGFLRAPTREQCIADAGSGPVVVLLTSQRRSDALIVLRGNVWSIPLSGLTPQKVGERILLMSGAIATSTSAQSSQTELEAAEESILQTLGWLWCVIGEPVVAAVTARAGGEPTPRVWWIPTGLLGFLPIHAAGHGNGPSVYDSFVSSYAPTIRALGQARRQQQTNSTGTLLVAMPETPGASPLRGATVECDLIAQIAPSAHQLSGRAATRDRVLTGLARHRYFHFAGHAEGNLMAPSSGALFLHDHERRRFTVADVVELDLVGKELAFLAGCDTALAGLELADEVITLMSAFHVAGFRHVVGCLWAVADGIAGEVAEPTWRAVQANTASPRIAEGVDQAVRKLREDYPRDPSLWAGYMHIGP